MRKLIMILAAVLLALPVMGKDGVAAGGDKVFRVGADASADYFIPVSGFGPVSVGLGVRARYGRPDQWVNLIGGLRFIYGSRLQGFQIPLLANVNLIRAEALSAYLGAGYEFDFIGTYWGCMKFQTGVLLGPHYDIRLFYKPYQGDLGLGFTYYF